MKVQRSLSSLLPALGHQCAHGQDAIVSLCRKRVGVVALSDGIKVGR